MLSKHSSGLGADMLAGADNGSQDTDDEDDVFALNADFQVGSLEELVPRAKARRLSGGSASARGTRDEVDGAGDSSGPDDEAGQSHPWFDVASETQKAKRVFEQAVEKMKARMSAQHEQMRATLDVRRNSVQSKDMVETKIVHNRAEALMSIKSGSPKEWGDYCSKLAAGPNPSQLGVALVVFCHH